MKRKDALNALRFAGYHGDHGTATRLYIENRISRDSANAAFYEGARAKKNGMPCGCKECSAATSTTTTEK